MYLVLILVSVIVLLCIFTSNALYRFGVPSLLIFLLFGIIMSPDGLGRLIIVDFDVAENIASFALILIMFYGGFGTSWRTAKPMAVRAGLMSSLGTVLTAFIIGFLSSLVFKVPFIYGLLFGSVVGSTDAASVFSILRSRKLNLKGGLAPLLEVESGSNDPFSYMLTIITISAIQMQGSGLSFVGVAVAITQQIGMAVGIGAAVSVLTVLLLKRLHLEVTEFYPLLLFAIVLLSYSLTGVTGGNGYLCVYILGIVVGNNQFLHKISTVHFFDSFSWLMQILLFFILGLLSSPAMLSHVVIPGMLLSFLLIVVARPIATFCILSWFKTPIKQQMLVSWVGLRGAASIAFAIISTKALGGSLPYDLFHLVFFVALFSVSIQGSLTPFLARKLDLVDTDADNSVMKTFTDYFEETHTQLFEYKVSSDDKLQGKRIVDSNIPEDVLIVMIKRNNEIVMPKGSIKLLADDVLVLSGEDFSFFSG
ncbi:MAG: potassium/proton antiporter [Oscillospiraceae bacterium]|nr:potassium/proton antiporter [Oscillospiraceae bacterium]